MSFVVVLFYLYLYHAHNTANCKIAMQLDAKPNKSFISHSFNFSGQNHATELLLLHIYFISVEFGWILLSQINLPLWFVSSCLALLIIIFILILAVSVSITCNQYLSTQLVDFIPLNDARFCFSLISILRRKNHVVSVVCVCVFSFAAHFFVYSFTPSFKPIQKLRSKRRRLHRAALKHTMTRKHLSMLP